MKTRIFLNYIILIFLLLGCSSIKRSKAIYNDIGFTIYNGVENYYYTYLAFPDSVDKLIEYLWEQRLNRANNYFYSSFTEFCNSNNVNKVYNVPVQQAINFLNKNKKCISISIHGDVFIMNYCGKDAVEIECNYCTDKSMPWNNKFLRHRFHTFDSLGKITKNHYEDIFDSIQKRLMKKYSNFLKRTRNDGESVGRFFLLSYKGNGKISSVCPEDSLNLQGNPFIYEMVLSLDSLLKKDVEIKSIIFLTSLRY